MGDIIADLDRDALTWGVAQEKHGGEDWGDTYKAAPNVWLELYSHERGHLVKVAKVCIDTGIDERRVQLAEQQGAAIVAVIKATLPKPQRRGPQRGGIDCWPPLESGRLVLVVPFEEPGGQAVTAGVVVVLGLELTGQ